LVSREQRKEQFDWLATNTDDITNQSNSLFLVRAKKLPTGKRTLTHDFIVSTTLFYSQALQRSVGTTR
jgi:hypothetical protein